MASDPGFKAKERVLNRFVLSVVAFERSKQLIRGARPRTDLKSNSPVTTALQEIADEHIIASESEGENITWKFAT